MRLRWSHPLAGAALFALAALLAAPGGAPAASAKMKPTTPTKAGQLLTNEGKTLLDYFALQSVEAAKKRGL